LLALSVFIHPIVLLLPLLRRLVSRGVRGLVKWSVVGHVRARHVALAVASAVTCTTASTATCAVRRIDASGAVVAFSVDIAIARANSVIGDVPCTVVHGPIRSVIHNGRRKAIAVDPIVRSAVTLIVSAVALDVMATDERGVGVVVRTRLCVCSVGVSLSAVAGAGVGIVALGPRRRGVALGGGGALAKRGPRSGRCSVDADSMAGVTVIVAAAAAAAVVVVYIAADVAAVSVTFAVVSVDHSGRRRGRSQHG
jgi:hypothetical protein